LRVLEVAIWRYILDLSMATDLLLWLIWDSAVCSTDDNFWKVVDRQKNWEDLPLLGIKRGLLVSLDPRNLNSGSLAGVILPEGDTLPSVCYSEHIA